MRRCLFLLIFIAVSSTLPAQETGPAKSATGPSEIKIGGAVATPFSLSLDDMKKMPRKTVRVENAHAKKTEVYEGVPLTALLQKA